MIKTLLHHITDYAANLPKEPKKLHYVNIEQFDKNHGTSLSQIGLYKEFINVGGNENIISEIYSNRKEQEYIDALDAVSADEVQHYLTIKRNLPTETLDRVEAEYDMKVKYSALWLILQQNLGRFATLEEYAEYGMELNKDSLDKQFGSNWRSDKVLSGGIKYRYVRDYWAFLRQDESLFRLAKYHNLGALTSYLFDVFYKVDGFCYTPDIQLRPIGVIYTRTNDDSLKKIEDKFNKMQDYMKCWLRCLSDTEGWREDSDRIHVITDNNLDKLRRSFSDSNIDNSLKATEILKNIKLRNN